MDRMLKFGKYLISGFVVLVLIGLFMPTSSVPAQKSENDIRKTHSISLEDMFINSDRQTRYELPSYYDGDGDIVFTIFADEAYGDMICRAMAFQDDNYGGMKYFIINGPYQRQYTDKTINIGPIKGVIGQTIVECAVAWQTLFRIAIIRISTTNKGNKWRK